MKIEHITKLILKFIGGGIINIPTKFLKWIKVESPDNDNGNDDGNSSGNNNISFIPASIQPKYLIKANPNSEVTPELVNIEDFTLEVGEYLLVYDKEAIISLGINENDLNSLTSIPLQDIFSNNDLSNSLQINNDIARNNIIFYSVGYTPYQAMNADALMMIKLTDSYNQILNNIYLFKVENDNMFIFIMQSSQTPVNSN